MKTWNEFLRETLPSPLALPFRSVMNNAESSDLAESPALEQDDEVLEVTEDFDFDGFQVVRREFFAHMREPSIAFDNCKIFVNNACLSKFPNTEFVQILINRESKILALRPCAESARDSFMWCNYKHKAKWTTCRLFFAKVFTMMDWNPEFKYKMLGKIVHANGEYLIAFDLTSTEVFKRTVVEGEKVKKSRTPVFPEEWQNQFGLSFKEHRQSLRINIFEGYAVYSIKGKEIVEPKDLPEAPSPFAYGAPANQSKEE